MNVPNCLTAARILLALGLIFVPTYSPWFYGMYALCGATDVLDGYLARKLHRETRLGEKLDSAADLIFAAVCLGKLFPILTFPLWLWVWVGAIALGKILLAFRRRAGGKGFAIPHTAGNKLTGALLFFLPLLPGKGRLLYGAVVALTGTYAVWEEAKQIEDKI